MVGEEHVGGGSGPGYVLPVSVSLSQSALRTAPGGGEVPDTHLW